MLKIGITSRALFDLDSSHLIFKNYGLEAYKEYQIVKENCPLKPGQAFSLVKKLLAKYYKKRIYFKKPNDLLIKKKKFVEYFRKLSIN